MHGGREKLLVWQLRFDKNLASLPAPVVLASRILDTLVLARAVLTCSAPRSTSSAPIVRLCLGACWCGGGARVKGTPILL